MKIALVTIHRAGSYGALLQTFATQKALMKWGEVAIVDYRKPLIDKALTLVRFGPKLRDSLSAAKDILRLVPRYKAIQNFHKFIARDFDLVGRSSSLLELKQHRLELDFDVFVAGSDQIWNPRITSDSDKLDPVFFLDFVKDKKKISYASSVGDYQFTLEQAELLKTLLSSFSSISVREIGTAVQFRSLLKRDVAHVLDPTFLLSRSEWIDSLSLEPAKSLKGYLVVYALKKNPLLRSVVSAIAKARQLRIVAVDQDPFLGLDVDHHVRDAGPRELLEWLLGASFVITNSFHGTAFALNFRKPFVSVAPPSGVNRIESLLEELGLRGRMVTDSDNIEVVLESDEEIGDATFRLESSRSRSFEYLENALAV